MQTNELTFYSPFANTMYYFEVVLSSLLQKNNVWKETVVYGTLKHWMYCFISVPVFRTYNELAICIIVIQIN